MIFVILAVCFFVIVNIRLIFVRALNTQEVNKIGKIKIGKLIKIGLK